MIPSGTPTTASDSDVLLSPDSLPRASLLVDYERGGTSVGDASAGMNVQDWRVRLDGDAVKLGAAPYTAETTLFTATGVTEISLAFDQLMRPVVAYVQAGAARLWWYDPTVPGMTTTTFAGMRSPFLTLDDKRASSSATSDVVLFYISGSNLCFRLQRERYATEHVWAALSSAAAYIRRAGFTTTNRLRVDIVGANLAGGG